jgi:hypothetical protein
VCLREAVAGWAGEKGGGRHTCAFAKGIDAPLSSWSRCSPRHSTATTRTDILETYSSAYGRNLLAASMNCRRTGGLLTDAH